MGLGWVVTAMLRGKGEKDQVVVAVAVMAAVMVAVAVAAAVAVIVAVVAAVRLQHAEPLVRSGCCCCRPVRITPRHPQTAP